MLLRDVEHGVGAVLSAGLCALDHKAPRDQAVHGLADRRAGNAERFGDRVDAQLLAGCEPGGEDRLLQKLTDRVRDMDKGVLCLKLIEACGQQRVAEIHG